MKSLLKVVIVSVGLGKPARAAWFKLRTWLKARGWMAWRPLVPEDAFADCVRHGIRKLREVERPDEFGDYFEFGVSRGTSLATAHRVLREESLSRVRQIGFDSFEGMPPEAEKEGWPPGVFASTLSATQRYLAERGVDFSRVELVKGWFSETLTDETRSHLELDKASLIMVDCDIYSATKEALTFCTPHIQRNAVLFFDDWGHRSDYGQIGQKEAFEEFAAANPDLSFEALPAYIPQARVFFVRRLSLT